jgi:hypothetical protein
LLNNTQQTLEAVEGMTPVQKTLKEAANSAADEETPDNDQESTDQQDEDKQEKKTSPEGQLTQLEATFELSQVSQ